MSYYDLFNRDEAFEKRYNEKPHLYAAHERSFNRDYNDKYLHLANNFHPDDYEEWIKQSLDKKLYDYERDLYAKVDRVGNAFIISYYILNSVIWYYREENELVNSLYMRFIYDYETTEMYHYRSKKFKNIAYVMLPCTGAYQFGGYTDMDRFITQRQRQLDDKSVALLKSIPDFKYLPIELFPMINVYNLFDVDQRHIYQYEILLKQGLRKLASDMELGRQFITPENFKLFRKEIMSGMRWNKLYPLIHYHDLEVAEKKRKEEEHIRRKEIKQLEAQYADLPKHQFDLGDYILRQPESRQDIQKEGKELHHCVATYFEKVLLGETKIYFLRKKEEPEKPFYTVEIRNGEVVQVRTENNRTDPKVTEIVKSWNTERKMKERSVKTS